MSRANSQHHRTTTDNITNLRSPFSLAFYRFQDHSDKVNTLPYAVAAIIGAKEPSIWNVMYERDSCSSVTARQHSS